MVVASPDPGGVKRAQLFRETLEPLLGRPCGSAYLEKRRTEGVVSGSLLAGEVRDATVLLVDDLISTGGTIVRAARTCLQSGARRVVACAAHGLFARVSNEAMLDPALSASVVTDSVVQESLSAAARSRVQIVSVAPAFAAAIKALHRAAADPSAA